MSTEGSCETRDSLRVLGGWTGVDQKMIRQTPMIITTGVSGPSGRTEERVCKGSAPPGHCPLSRLLVGVPSRGPSPRPVRPAGRASLWTGRPWLERVSFNSPPATPLAPPTPCGCAGSIATRSAGAGLRIRGSSWIFGVGGCNVARRNEKTRRRAGLSEALGGSTPWTSGNSFWRKQLPEHHSSLAASSRIVQAKSRQIPVTDGYSH